MPKFITVTERKTRVRGDGSGLETAVFDTISLPVSRITKVLPVRISDWTVKPTQDGTPMLDLTGIVIGDEITVVTETVAEVTAKLNG